MKPKSRDLFTVVHCARLPFTLNVCHHHLLLKIVVMNTDSLGENEYGLLECGICHEDVNKELGSYYCFECEYIVHVKCVLDPGLYYGIESKDDYEKLNGNPALMDSSFLVIKRIKLGENVISSEIKHFTHEHILVLYDEAKDDKCCDFCSLLIETSFYHCSECDFCLYKSCAKLPRIKQFWLLPQFSLNPTCFFICQLCLKTHTSFAYKAVKNFWSVYICVQCAEFSLARPCQGHEEHLLFLYHKDNGQCNACGDSMCDQSAYTCKDCNFNVHPKCTLLPQTVRHKCDEHRLTLIYHEDNDYSEYHYCDICEEIRNPNIWFYHCTICDNSAHLKCVLGEYSFIKLRSKITTEIAEIGHPQSLVLVQKVPHNLVGSLWMWESWQCSISCILLIH
ncbi:Cysteine/Histidine-rich C1 domain family protein, putative [Theobroma cacao]|uniref:Cysteine/Histidine-rich C1 domain family protein, putative n=1 Tax=Theobroma cacao TaxID=3641 RepID=A0A061FMJ2_THECC|nr:Cysteine/Histidine-rich C1 domain family protein, putative [Theobroma cacao]